MHNIPKPPFMIPVSVQPDGPLDRDEVGEMVDALFEVLERHDAGSNEGVLALLTSFIQTASNVLELSAEEDVEHNRKSLLAMIERAKMAIDTWSAGPAPSAYVH